MLDKLTQEQIWGLQFLTQAANELAAKNNPDAEAFNRGIPEEFHRALLPVFDSYETFVAARIVEIAHAGYVQLTAAKEQFAIQAFRSATPEEQAAILQRLQVPDVLS